VDVNQKKMVDAGVAGALRVESRRTKTTTREDKEEVCSGKPPLDKK